MHSSSSSGVSHSALLLSPPHSAMHHLHSMPRDSNSRTPPRNTSADWKHKRRDSNNADSKKRSGGSQDYDNAADDTDNTHHTHRRARHNKGHNTDASARQAVKVELQHHNQKQTRADKHRITCLRQVNLNQDQTQTLPQT